MRKSIQSILGAVACTLLCSAAVSVGQAPASTSSTVTAAVRPAFDVATVKPSAPPDPGRMQAEMQAGHMPKFGPSVEGSRAEYNFMSLRDLIALAYNVKAYEVSGPDWLNSERFDILAKMPDDSTKDDAPIMLQVLLEDRFKLVTHAETEEHPVQALVVGKGGPKLKDATEAPVPFDDDTPLKPGEMKMNMPDGPARIKINSDGSSTMNMGAKGTFTQRMDMPTQSVHIEASTLTMDGLADLLNRSMQMGGNSARQVVNLTGLKGTYQVAFDISIADLLAQARAQGANIPGAPVGGAPGEASDPGGSGATIAESLHRVGLNLEQRKAPVKQLVVDHAEKTPTAN